MIPATWTSLTVAEALPGDKIKIRVAVADVDALVKDGSAIDQHARHNTTSVYTAAEIFPMLPEKLSTDLTSLNFNEERLAVVVELVVGTDGAVRGSDIYRARVRNHAKLAYNSVAAWLDGGDAVPDGIAAVSGLAENLRVQDRIAQSLKNLRHVHGALSLETIEAKPVFDGDQIRDLEVEEKNRAKEIIEDFMIAANGVTARYLAAKKFPSIRRVVRTPKRWDRIVELAREHGFTLPGTPDSVALDAFLVKERAADPQRFPDLSLAVIKLLGAGEYVAELPGATAPGHFGLAVKDYAHSTAPNRRYPDLVTQRLVKAAIAGQAAPYSYAQLDAWPGISPKKRMPPTRSNGRSANPRQRSSWNRGSANSSTPLSRVHRTKAPGPGCSASRLKERWCAGSRAWMSATGFACN